MVLKQTDKQNPNWTQLRHTSELPEARLCYFWQSRVIPHGTDSFGLWKAHAPAFLPEQYHGNQSKHRLVVFAFILKAPVQSIFPSLFSKFYRIKSFPCVFTLQVESCFSDTRYSLVAFAPNLTGFAPICTKVTLRPHCTMCPDTRETEDSKASISIFGLGVWEVYLIFKTLGHSEEVNLFTVHLFL